MTVTTCFSHLPTGFKERKKRIELRERKIELFGEELNECRPKQKECYADLVFFTSSLINLQKEAQRVFHGLQKDVCDETAPKDVYRKRKSYKLGLYFIFSAYGQEQLPFVSIVVEWMVTGGSLKDESIHSCHKYENWSSYLILSLELRSLYLILPPSLNALLALCSDESVFAKFSLGFCINQIKNVLSSH
ncbi:hypothetical protein MTR_3g108370 [Medicago truncatula]|uniref:Uncharacterized protein n=1 Tax=Medicago truncatula TaxID=3880 RepID=G7JCA2_MEDTR|nr:hypothetical protein MTR_3g108370 [Medicago truncatula]